MTSQDESAVCCRKGRSGADSAVRRPWAIPNPPSTIPPHDALCPTRNFSIGLAICFHLQLAVLRRVTPSRWADRLKQSSQLAAPAGTAVHRKDLTPDHTTGQADQDWGEGGASCPIRDLPDGGAVEGVGSNLSSESVMGMNMPRQACQPFRSM